MTNTFGSSPSFSARELGGFGDRGCDGLPSSRSLDGQSLNPRGFDRAHVLRAGTFHVLGDRMTPVGLYEEYIGDVPKDAIRLNAPYGFAGPWDQQEVLVHCPLTGMPFTKSMADIVGTTSVGLQHMVHRQSPLGLAPEAWEQVQRDLFAGLQQSGLLTRRAMVMVGGSSVSGFSSSTTALTKPLKEVPATNEQLSATLYKALTQRHSDVTSAKLHLANSRARRVTAEMFKGLPMRPQSPPWGYLHRTRIEPYAPDIDLQIYAPDLIKEVMDHPEFGSLVSGLKDARLSTLDNDIVLELNPAFEKTVEVLKRANVEVEFVTDREQMLRKDWWPVTRPANL